MNRGRQLYPKNNRRIYYIPINFKEEDYNRVLKYLESKQKVNKSKFIRETIFEKLEKEGY